MAFSASVTRSFFSFTSTSLPPPIFSTATPPLSFARRSCSRESHHGFCVCESVQQRRSAQHPKDYPRVLPWAGM